MEETELSEGAKLKDAHAWPGRVSEKCRKTCNSDDLLTERRNGMRGRQVHFMCMHMRDHQKYRVREQDADFASWTLQHIMHFACSTLKYTDIHKNQHFSGICCCFSSESLRASLNSAYTDYAKIICWLGIQGLKEKNLGLN